MYSMVFLLIISCREKEKATEENKYLDTRTTEENRGFLQDPYTSVDWEGSYSGVLPCADCRGVETTVEISKDNTFDLKQAKLSFDGAVKGEVYETSGNFSWIEDKTVISLKGRDSILQFKVGHLFLMPLDRHGNELEEVRGNNFRLLKE